MSTNTVRHALEGRLISVTQKAERIHSKASNESRDITPEEQRILDSLFKEGDELQLELDKLNEAPQAAPVVAGVRKTQPNPIGGPGALNAPGGSEKAADGGFRNFGSFLACANQAVRGTPDSRLIAASFEEKTGEGGGFLVPQRFSDEIFSNTLATSGVLDRVTRLPMPNGNLFVAGADTEDHGSSTVAGGGYDQPHEPDQNAGPTAPWHDQRRRVDRQPEHLAAAAGARV